MVSVSRVPFLEVNSLLPQVFEDVGIFKKKFSKTGGRSRPPSSYGTQRGLGISIVADNIDLGSTSNHFADLTDRSFAKESDRGSQATRLDTSEAVDLTAISKSLENSLANLSQVKSGNTRKAELMTQLGRKLSFKKKAAADAVASVEHSMDSASSKQSGQNSEKKPRFRPLKPIGLANPALKSKIGEDVFLKSIFGSKNKRTVEKTASPEQSVDRVSQGSTSKDGKGANGARMKFVRNILVPVADFYSEIKSRREEI